MRTLTIIELSITFTFFNMYTIAEHPNLLEKCETFNKYYLKQNVLVKKKFTVWHSENSYFVCILNLRLL